MPSIEVREIVLELSERLHVETLRGYPCFSDDLLHDDLGKFALDVIELSSKSMILDISYVLYPLQNMGIAGSR